MKAKMWLRIFLGAALSPILLSGCASTPKTQKMVGMWAERFEGDKSLEVWARMGPNGQQQALVLFIEPGQDGTAQYEAICGGGGYQDITLQNATFDYEQDRLNAKVRRIRNNRVEVTVNSGCIPEEVYVLDPIRETDSNGTAQDSLTVEKSM